MCNSFSCIKLVAPTRIRAIPFKKIQGGGSAKKFNYGGGEAPEKLNRMGNKDLIWNAVMNYFLWGFWSSHSQTDGQTESDT